VPRRISARSRSHLHHDNDKTPPHCGSASCPSRNCFASRHGLLPRHRANRRTGVWLRAWQLGPGPTRAPDGRWCGVNNELDVPPRDRLLCGFHVCRPPRARTQTAQDQQHLLRAGRSAKNQKSHDWGVDVGAAPPSPNGLMLIQGPPVIGLAQRRKGRPVSPRIENGCIQASQNARALRRLDLWMKAPGRHLRCRPGLAPSSNCIPTGAAQRLTSRYCSGSRWFAFS